MHAELKLPFVKFHGWCFMKDDFLYASDADHELIKKIQDGVLRNQKRDNFIHADLIRAENIVFWDYHYSVRAFIMDLSDKVWFKKRYNVSDIYLRFLMKDQMVPDCNFDRVAREMIIAYNSYYNKNPKFSYDALPGEMKNTYKLKNLTKDEVRAVKFFLYVALKYGYTFTSKVYPHQIQRQIIDVARRNREVLEIDDIKRKQFIKYRTDRFAGVRFNYADKYGKQFFDVELGGNLYLYIDAEAYGRSGDIDKIYASINGWKKKKSLDYYVRGEDSSIQVVISGDAIRKAKSSLDLARDVDKKVSDAVSVYLVWMAKSKLVDSRELACTVKRMCVPQSEQVSNGARAIGLWLWDLIHFGKKKQAEAIRCILDVPFDHCRKAAEERALRRDYALADKCIKQRAVLKYTS